MGGRWRHATRTRPGRSRGGRRQQNPIAYRRSASDAGPASWTTTRVATIALPTRMPLTAATAAGSHVIRARSEDQLPRLADEVVAEASVLLLLDEAEAGLRLDVAPGE